MPLGYLNFPIMLKETEQTVSNLIDNLLQILLFVQELIYLSKHTNPNVWRATYILTYFIQSKH